jgi:hypothetical protein
MRSAAEFDGYVKGDRILVNPETWQRWWNFRARIPAASAQSRDR